MRKIDLTRKMQRHALALRPRHILWQLRLATEPAIRLIEAGRDDGREDRAGTIHAARALLHAIRVGLMLQILPKGIHAIAFSESSGARGANNGSHCLRHYF